MRALNGLVVALVLTAFSGCCIPQRAEELIVFETRAHDADLAEWHSLTPAQRKESYQASRDSYHVLSKVLLDTPLPKDLQDPKAH